MIAAWRTFHSRQLTRFCRQEPLIPMRRLLTAIWAASRCLTSMNPGLPRPTLTRRRTRPNSKPPSPDELVDELLISDIIVIGAPMYNFSSTLVHR
jgi:hypothetical protein